MLESTPHAPCLTQRIRKVPRPSQFFAHLSADFHGGGFSTASNRSLYDWATRQRSMRFAPSYTIRKNSAALDAARWNVATLWFNTFGIGIFCCWMDTGHDLPFKC